MGNMRHLVIGATVIAMAAVAFVLLPTHRCGDDCLAVETDHLIQRAENGDQTAIALALQQSRRDGVEIMIDHWLLQSALTGDQAGCSEYLARYKKFSTGRQTEVRKIIEKKQASAGRTCLLTGM